MKMIFILYSVLLFAFSTTSLYSQYSQQWVKRFNGTMNAWDSGTDLASDSKGNVYVAGELTVNQNGNKDILLIKYNSAGEEEWVRTYNGPDNNDEQSVSVKVDRVGNIILAGSVFRAGNAMDLAVLKYDPQGDLIWSRFYNEAPNSLDQLAAMELDNDNNIFITGILESSDHHNSMAVLKYTPSGDLEWIRKYENPDPKLGTGSGAIVIDNLGNVIVTGAEEHTHDLRHNPTVMLTVKYSNDGVEQWARTDETAHSSHTIDVDSDNNIYVGGTSFSTSVERIYLVKYSPAGSQVWTKTILTAGYSDNLTKLMVDDNNDIIVGGNVNYVTSYIDLMVNKYDSDGTLIWERVFPGNPDCFEQSIDMCLNHAGDIYMGGYTTIEGTWDNLLVKYDAAGSFKWSKTYNGEGNDNDLITKVILTPANDVVVTGFSTGLSTEMDCLTISYSQTTGINNNSNTVNGYTLSQNYPNPFNPETSIEFNIGNKGHVMLTVYDAGGRVITDLVNNDLDPGSYNVKFNGAGLSSGVYFYKLVSNDFSQVRKMLLVK